MSKRAKAALVGAVGLIALATGALIKPWEGKENVAYHDIVGVLTVCYGETEGVTPGMRATDAQCDAMLEKRLTEDFYRPLTRCIGGFDAKPLSWRAAILSLSYNVGTPAVCRSTAAKRGRQGDYRGSCEAMTWFNRAGGEVVSGLKRRREFGDAHRIGEFELCLEGLG